MSRIRSKPVEYLGHKSILSLRAFLCGYQFVPSNDLVWLDLNSWIQRRTGIATGSHAGDSILLLIHGSEEEALDAYFHEFDACLAGAGETARDKLSWPQPPPIRNSIPSKLDLLKVVRQRPGMYFGEKSATLLWAYLAGYDLSRADLGQAPDKFDLLDFELWLRVRTELKGPFRWDRILNFGAFNDPGTACDMFFTSMDEYLADSNRC